MTQVRSLKALEAPAILKAAAGKKGEEHVIGALQIYENGDFDRLVLTVDNTTTTEVAKQFVLSHAQHIIDGTVSQVRLTADGDQWTPDAEWVHNDGKDGLAKRRKHIKVSDAKKGLTVAEAIAGLSTPIGTNGATVMQRVLKHNLRSARYVADEVKAETKKVAKASKGTAAPDVETQMNAMMEQMQAKLMEKMFAGFMAKMLGESNDES